MGFLYHPEDHHKCQVPFAGSYVDGTIWQCDRCRKIYRLVVLKRMAHWDEITREEAQKMQQSIGALMKEPH